MQNERKEFIKTFIGKKTLTAKEVKDKAVVYDKRLFFNGIDKSDFVESYKEDKKTPTDINELWNKYQQVIKGIKWQ